MSVDPGSLLKAAVDDEGNGNDGRSDKVEADHSPRALPFLHWGQGCLRVLFWAFFGR